MQSFSYGKEKLLREINTIKLLPFIRSSDDFIIFNKMYECLTEFTIGDNIEFPLLVSFKKADIENALYFCLQEAVNTMYHSIGRGIENYLIRDLVPTKVKKPEGRDIIVSPELGNYSKSVSYSLGENQYINLNDTEVCIVSDDINFIEGNYEDSLYCKIVLRFSKNNIELFEVDYDL